MRTGFLRWLYEELQTLLGEFVADLGERIMSGKAAR